MLFSTYVLCTHALRLALLSFDLLCLAELSLATPAALGVLSVTRLGWGLCLLVCCNSRHEDGNLIGIGSPVAPVADCGEVKGC